MLKSAPGRYVATNMHTNVMMVPYKPSYPTICTQTTVQLSSLRIIMLAVPMPAATGPNM